MHCTTEIFNLPTYHLASQQYSPQSLLEEVRLSSPTSDPLLGSAFEDVQMVHIYNGV